MRPYDAVIFDLLTALLDSWSLWNRVAGSEEAGLRWRRTYLELTYRTGRYRPYEVLIAEAAQAAGIDVKCAEALVRHWPELPPWPDTHDVVSALADRVPLGIATNCSERLGPIAAARAGGPFSAVVTAEQAGYYKPRPEPYRAVLAKLGTDPARTLFVAGSAADVPGATGVGMPVFWHNRRNLAALDDVKPDFTANALRPLLDIVR
jgi:2-haloacid dehalogenase